MMSVTETLNGKVLFIFNYLNFQFKLHPMATALNSTAPEALGGHEF